MCDPARVYLCCEAGDRDLRAAIIGLECLTSIYVCAFGMIGNRRERQRAFAQFGDRNVIEVGVE